MAKSLEERYYIIKKYIDKVDFDLLWKGFKPLKYALYNETECFYDGKYIEKSADFLANTSIKYNGEYIAIWNVMEDLDPIILTSKIIHEMFHGFQNMNGETRFPNELEALFNYKYDDENLSIKLEEAKLTLKLLDSFNDSDFQKLLDYKKYRYDNFNNEFTYESKTEQVEGAANFVEMNALKQLSEELYNYKLNTLKENIVKENSYLPIRVLCYDTGALLLKVLSDNNISFNDGFTDEPFFYDLIKNRETKSIKQILSFTNIINNYYAKAKKIIDDAIEKNDVIEKDTYDILGVNYYNAIYYNGYIISIYFVMYGDMNSPHIEYGNFVIETKDGFKLSKIYKY